MSAENYPLIFVVDDNTIYSKLIASQLRSSNYNHIECYSSGEDCIANLHHKPDIIIQDYLMDGMSGVDVLKEAKKIHPEVEFLFLSGLDNFEIAVNTIKYGAYDYVVKDQYALRKIIEKVDQLKERQTTSIKPTATKVKIGVAMLILVLVSLFSVFGLS